MKATTIKIKNIMRNNLGFNPFSVHVFEGVNKSTFDRLIRVKADLYCIGRHLTEEQKDLINNKGLELLCEKSTAKNCDEIYIKSILQCLRRHPKPSKLAYAEHLLRQDPNSTLPRGLFNGFKNSSRLVILLSGNEFDLKKPFNV